MLKIIENAVEFNWFIHLLSVYFNSLHVILLQKLHKIVPIKITETTDKCFHKKLSWKIKFKIMKAYFIWYLTKLTYNYIPFLKMGEEWNKRQ